MNLNQHDRWHRVPLAARALGAYFFGRLSLYCRGHVPPRPPPNPTLPRVRISQRSLLFRRPFVLLALLVTTLTVPPDGRAQASRAERLPGPPKSTTSNGRASERHALEQLGQDIDAIITDQNFADATWGISVVSCQSGEAIYRAN